MYILYLYVCTQLVLIICRFHICRIAYWIKFLSHPRVSPHGSVFVVTVDMGRMAEKCELPAEGGKVTPPSYVSSPAEVTRVWRRERAVPCRSRSSSSGAIRWGLNPNSGPCEWDPVYTHKFTLVAAVPVQRHRPLSRLYLLFFLMRGK